MIESAPSLATLLQTRPKLICAFALVKDSYCSFQKPGLKVARPGTHAHVRLASQAHSRSPHRPPAVCDEVPSRTAHAHVPTLIIQGGGTGLGSPAGVDQPL